MTLTELYNQIKTIGIQLNTGQIPIKQNGIEVELKLYLSEDLNGLYVELEQEV